MTLFSSAYLPPISYIRKIISVEKAYIEIHETYAKQTYRNRCYIYTANGRLPLIIPVIKTQGNRTKTRDIEISYTEKWQQNHMRAIESAYNASPYFLYYRDEFFGILSKPQLSLIALNHELLVKVLELLNIRKEIAYTKEFVKDTDAKDFRNRFSPKKPDKLVSEKYFQVFENKFGFIPNLSIIDLLFNLGPESLSYLVDDKS